jgi:hypothetical protein
MLPVDALKLTFHQFILQALMEFYPFVSDLHYFPEYHTYWSTEDSNIYSNKEINPDLWTTNHIFFLLMCEAEGI